MISPAVSACAGFSGPSIASVRKPGQDSWSISTPTMPKPPGSNPSSSSGSPGGGNSPGGFTPHPGGNAPNPLIGVGSNAVAMTEREILRSVIDQN